MRNGAQPSLETCKWTDKGVQPHQDTHTHTHQAHLNAYSTKRVHKQPTIRCLYYDATPIIIPVCFTPLSPSLSLSRAPTPVLLVFMSVPNAGRKQRTRETATPPYFALFPPLLPSPLLSSLLLPSPPPPLPPSLQPEEYLGGILFSCPAALKASTETRDTQTQVCFLSLYSTFISLAALRFIIFLNWISVQGVWSVWNRVWVGDGHY